MSLLELRELAKGLNIRGYSTARKDDLIQRIEAMSKKAGAPVPEPPPTPVPTASGPAVKQRKVNEWNSYLNQYAKENGMPLSKAMGSAKTAYAEYKAKKLLEDKPTGRDCP